jgi:hypothetical protein
MANGIITKLTADGSLAHLEALYKAGKVYHVKNLVAELVFVEGGTKAGNASVLFCIPVNGDYVLYETTLNVLLGALKNGKSMPALEPEFLKHGWGPSPTDKIIHLGS